MTNEKTVLVLGATGGIGGEVARQLRDAGWQVRAMGRRVDPAGEQRDGMTWVRGDAMNPSEVVAAAAGCSVLVHAVNPPGYKRWSRVVIPMIESTITAARRHNATIVLPGTVYNYGPDAFPLLKESSPQRPVTRKGAIRVRLEQRLRDYAESGGKVIVVRAGDYFGPRSDNNWFGGGMITAGSPVKRIWNPSSPGAGHQWAYLPDVARTMVQLLEKRSGLERFASFHMGGHWDADGTSMAKAIQASVAAAGPGTPRITPFPWWLLHLAAPFNETMRELREMRYLWQQPVQLDNSKLVAALGAEPHTPLDQAVSTSLAGLGCIEPDRTSAKAAVVASS